ncbi:MAG TPA: DNA-formamidopyrimidine glycosylase family protein [Candidatus Limnocylindria bacterium]|nr:DNA-formamidopyrimidine glycosylase family protein [Candidatus Limnocylindria bacterium]
MPEGDNLARIADVLQRALGGTQISAARGRPGGARLERVVGTGVVSIEARGKHLLVHFEAGLTLHTHLALHGSWHVYRQAERWRRSPSRAVAVLEAGSAVAVCFDAPTVELIETRALAVHPQLRRLGPDAARDDFDIETALAAAAAPANAERPIGEVLIDQRVVAGLGNVYRSEVCFIERVDPFTPAAEVSAERLRALVATGHRLLLANRAGGRRVTTGGPAVAGLYVYGRAGRPCRRCATPVRRAYSAARRPVYWCPRCQPRKTGQARDDDQSLVHSHGTAAQARTR